VKLRRYAFTSRWRIPATPEACWTVTERMLRPGGASWWPGVRVAEAPIALAPGEELTLVVQTPLGYRLRIRLTLGEVSRPHRLVARSAGDLAGEGAVTLAAVGAAGTIVDVRWEVATHRRWMNATAPVLRPAFVLAHAVVMRAGERGLRRAVRAPSETRNAGSSASEGGRPDAPG
jgi:hypothetical protein